MTAPGSSRRTAAWVAVEPLAAAIGVDVAGADIGAAHRAAGVGVHGADAAVEQTRDDADGERARGRAR